MENLQDTINYFKRKLSKPLGDGRRKAYTEAVEAMERLAEYENSNTWIPVSDRLPEETGYYLVTLKTKLSNEDFADEVVLLYSKDDKSFMCYNNLITAWQPIPEPYKTKEGKNED